MILAGVEYAFPTSPWVMIFGPICIILGVCASLLVPLRSQLCFLDMTSIHQSNPKLLERGIYGIGGFLSVSKELRVLYTPPYFTSLWLNSTESLIHMEIEQRYKKHIKKHWTLHWFALSHDYWLQVVPLRDGGISHLKSSRKDDIFATASCTKHFCEPDNKFSFNWKTLACASLLNSNETLRFLERSVLVVTCCMWVLTFVQWSVTSLVDAEYRQGRHIQFHAKSFMASLSFPKLQPHIVPGNRTCNSWASSSSQWWWPWFTRLVETMGKKDSWWTTWSASNLWLN